MRTLEIECVPFLLQTDWAAVNSKAYPSKNEHVQLQIAGTGNWPKIKGIAVPDYFQNNNKFGVDIGIPLRLSEGRGGYNLAKLKILETNYALSLHQQEIENKVKFYYNELIGLRQQVKIYNAAYLNYQTLFRGEDVRFKAGESSLFLLNSRENKVLEALQKLIELKTKFFKSQAAVQWAAGQLR